MQKTEPRTPSRARNKMVVRIDAGAKIFVLIPDTYIRNNRKNIWEVATTDPMKNPTAMELWNFRIIMVPPIDSMRSISADHMEAKPSAMDRVPMTKMDISISEPVIPRIEYLEKELRLSTGGRQTKQNRLLSLLPPAGNQFPRGTAAERICQEGGVIG